MDALRNSDVSDTPELEPKIVDGENVNAKPADRRMHEEKRAAIKAEEQRVREEIEARMAAQEAEPTPADRRGHDKADPVKREDRDAYVTMTIESSEGKISQTVVLPNIYGRIASTQRSVDELFKGCFGGIRAFFPLAKIGEKPKKKAAKKD